MTDKPRGLHKADSSRPWAYHMVINGFKVWIYNFNVDLFRAGDLAKFNHEAINWINSVCPKQEADE